MLRVMSMVESLPLDPYRLREDFPILSRLVHEDRALIYLDNAATTQHPRAVIDALVGVYEKHYANVHRGIHTLSEESTSLYEAARESIRQFIGAKKLEEIVFTSGTTAGVNLVARSWGDANVKAGDEILLTEMEHHSNIVPWQQLAQRTGCVIRFVPLTDDYQLDMQAFEQLLSSKTKLVAFTACSNVLGAYNPAEKIIRLAHAAGALTLMDAAQAVPHAPLDVQKLDVDFLVFSGHKMLGPSGVGILYGKEALLEAMPPFLGGGSMIKKVTKTGFEDAMLPAKFEAGTPPIAPALAMTAAIDYLKQVGLENIHRHEALLAQQAIPQLQNIPGLKLFTPPSDAGPSGIVSFAIEGQSSRDIAEYLDMRGVAIRAGHHCAMPLHERLGVSTSCRASFYLYNTREEVDAFVAAVASAQRVLAKRRR